MIATPSITPPVSKADGSAEAAHSAGGTVLVVAVVYMTWIVATYLLEGARQTFLRPEAQIDRLAYALVANLAAGIVLPLWALRTLAAQTDAAPRLARSHTLPCTAVGVAAAALIGLLMLFQMRPVRDVMFVINVFAQALPTSIAEVLVCWVLAAFAVDSTFRGRGGIASGVVKWLAGAVLFGVYHFAHSPPYNTWGMVAGLTGVGVVTGAYFFVSGELYGTILLHTFLATVGVTASLANAGVAEHLQSPRPLIYVTAAASVVLVVMLDVLWFRRGAGQPLVKDPPAGGRL